jgi:SNF2 family DNA or RNA helicase
MSSLVLFGFAADEQNSSNARVSHAVQFLCNGLEADLLMRLTTLNKKQPSEQELLEAASGKLMLMGKLLTKLRCEGRKVLIFSQFKIMLNVISDYLDLLEMPLERIDGDTKGVQTLLCVEQRSLAAIDSYLRGNMLSLCWGWLSE